MLRTARMSAEAEAVPRADAIWHLGCTDRRAMKLTYRLAHDESTWWADCVEVDVFAGGRSAFEAICRLRALLLERLLAEDASFLSRFGTFDLAPATTAYIDVPPSSRAPFASRC